MKKIALLSVLFALVVIVSLSAGTSRTYVQRVVWENGEILDLVTNTGSTHNENFIVTADIEETVGEVLGTNLATPISSIRLCKTGNGTIVPYYAAVFLQLGTFTTQWVAGQTINMSVTYVPTGAVANWSIVIPAGTTSILMTGEGQEQIVPGPPSTHTITGTFTSTNWNTEEVTINTTTPEDVEIQVSGSTYTVTVPDGWTGTITPSKDGYVFDPVSRDYTNVTADIADQDYVVKAYVNPNAPTITAPEAAQVFTFEAATPVTITWTNPAGFMPEYYETKWMEGEWTNAGLVNEWTTAALETGDYTFAVRGVIDTPQAKVYSRVDINGRSLSHANAASPKGAGTEASVSFSVIIYDIVPGNPFAIDTNTNITGSGTGFVGATVEAGDLPPVPNAGNFEIESSGIINLVGTGSVTLHFDFIPPLTASQWFVYLWEGQWTAVAGPLPSYDVVVDLGSKAPGDFGWAYGSGSDPSLPVELSAFNAIFTAQKFVKLTWISESETGLLGYRIYRGESNVQNNATSITPNMIDATNTSSTHVYTHEDHEVINNTGYYYWLEAVDLTHSTFYGPQYVEVIHEEVPELPLQTVMKSAYPNPFSANSVTNIHVDIKAGDSGTVTIYNVLGQAVKTFQVKEGFNPLTWNGRDSRNNACGSGIYFYRLSTPSKIETKKMVIVK